MKKPFSILSCRNTFHVLFLLKTTFNTQQTNAFSIDTTAANSAAASDVVRRSRPDPHVWPKLVTGGSNDPALGMIEEEQKKLGKPYGDFLDAGTGSYSLRWVAGLLYRHNDPINDPLYMNSYVAVTACEEMRQNTFREAQEMGIDQYGKVIIGNWAAGYDTQTYSLNNNDNEQSGKQKDQFGHGNQQCLPLEENQMFDTILADYLVGAVDHFAPFFQDLLFPRLCTHHLKSGGRLYITGLGPIPDKAAPPKTDDETYYYQGADVFCRLTKLRDACILLAGSRPYREHPPDWVIRNLDSLDVSSFSGQGQGMFQMKVLNHKKFPKKYNYEIMALQVEAARSTLQFIQDDFLRETMAKQIDQIDRECYEICEKAPNGKNEFYFGYDYVITAEKVPYYETG